MILHSLPLWDFDQGSYLGFSLKVLNSARFLNLYGDSLIRGLLLVSRLRERWPAWAFAAEGVVLVRAVRHKPWRIEGLCLQAQALKWATWAMVKTPHEGIAEGSMGSLRKGF